MNKHTERQGEHLEPPSADEMLAYSLGQLSREKAAEVWERLQQFPDLAAIYTAPFPEDGGGYVSEEQLDTRWAEMRGRLGLAAPRKVIWFPRILSVAAAIAIVALAGLLWQSQQRIRDLETERGTPRVMNEHLLNPDVRFRGPASEREVVRRDTDAKLVFEARGQYSYYDVEIHDLRTTPPRIVWRRTGLIPTGPHDIEILLPARGFAPGRYQIVVYGDTRKLDSFTFEVIP